MPKQPLAEVFGFPVDNLSPEADRYRGNKLCPFNNKVPSCTKDKAKNPLGVCSVFERDHAVITCPVRFRQDWLIAGDAAEFFFSADVSWTSVIEVRIQDKYGRVAGNVDLVLVSYDEAGRLLDFGSVEVQAVYISGNVRNPFEYYMQSPATRFNMNWTEQSNSEHYPRPDYLSSSRKRLAPQLIYKGGIFHAWGKKQVVAVDSNFFNTLPQIDEVDPQEAEMAWMIYDLQHNSEQNRYQLTRTRTVYTMFNAALSRITIAEVGDIQKFTELLQAKLDEKLEDGNPPDTHALLDVFESEDV